MSPVTSANAINRQGAAVDNDLETAVNSIPVSFLFGLLLEFKGHDAAASFENIGSIIVIYLVFSGIAYWLVCIQGLKENKPQPFLYGAMAMFFVIFSLFLETLKTYQNLKFLTGFLIYYRLFKLA